MMRSLPAVLVVVAAAAMLPMPAASQVAQGIEDGARVRVWLTSQPQALEGAAEKQSVRGTVISLSSDSLTIRIHPGAAPVALAWPAVSRLERSRGVPSRSSSAIWRGIQVAAMGALEFAILDEQRGHFSSTSRAMLVGAATGAGIGIVWGGFYPQERWSRVRLVRP